VAAAPLWRKIEGVFIAADLATQRGGVAPRILTGMSTYEPILARIEEQGGRHVVVDFAPQDARR
jgi:hypothetical protein